MDDHDAGVEHVDDGRDGSREASITRMGLRMGGWIGYNDDSVYIDQNDGEKIKIRHERLARVTLRNVEWDLAVMSLLLVGVGGFVGVTRNPIAGVAFGAVGVASLYWTYRKRYKLVLHVENKRKPISVYPTHPGECHETLVEQIRAGADADAE
jgi:hypothetical protein